MTVPADLQYTNEHEWVRLAADGAARCGITQHAADALGEVVFLDLPAVGTEVTAGTACGEIESTKSVSELFAPATGRITAVNEEAASQPDAVNTDPYGAGWLFEIEPSGAVEGLLDAAAYQQLIEAQEG